MRDMDELAHILYPEIYSDAGNSSSRRSMSGLGQRHPLHRDDPMYACSSAAEQVKLLSARFQKQQANSGSNESDGAGRKRAITSSSSSASNIKSGSSSSSRPSARSKRARLDNPVHNQDSNGHSNSSSSSSNSNRGSSSNGINSNGRVNPAATPRSPEISQSPIAVRTATLNSHASASANLATINGKLYISDNQDKVLDQEESTENSNPFRSPVASDDSDASPVPRKKRAFRE